MEDSVRNIKELAAGTHVSALLLVQSAERKNSRNGLYWNLELKDRSGSIMARIWSPQAETYEAIPAGAFVRIDARTGSYNNTPQLTVEQLTLLEPGEISALDLSQFIKTSGQAPEVMLAELERMFRTTLIHKPWRDFARAVLRGEGIRSGLLQLPAAVVMHHAYPGGLLEHSLAVCRNCMAAADLYPGMDRQALLVAAAFHDIGKIREYSMSNLVPGRTTEGMLLGHIAIGLEMLAPYLAKSELDTPLKEHFRHLIASHHGCLEFGSPVAPMTAEALVLHFADDLDAKMNQMKTLLDEDVPMGTWTPWQKMFERAMFQPCRTPVAEPDGVAGGDRRRRKGSEEGGALQCSLL